LEGKRRHGSKPCGAAICDTRRRNLK
jgi:hypothetical protein